jgi:hypothetical protein
MSRTPLPSCNRSCIQTSQLTACIALVNNGVVIVNKTLFHVVVILVGSYADIGLGDARQRYALCVRLFVNEEGMAEVTGVVVGWRLPDQAEYVATSGIIFILESTNDTCARAVTPSRRVKTSFKTILRAHYDVRPGMHVVQSAS